MEQHRGDCSSAPTALRRLHTRAAGLIALSSLLAAGGCATGTRYQGPGSSAENALRVQVCLPDKRVHFSDFAVERLENHPTFTRYTSQQLAMAPTVIRRVAASADPRTIQDYVVRLGDVRNNQGIKSEGSGSISLADSTVSDQPVFDSGARHPTRDYVALKVAAGNVFFWYKLPREIAVGRFSPWFAASSMEQSGSRPGIGLKLLRGGGIDMTPVAPGAPKMRVTLVKPGDKHLDPKADYLPALTTARLRYRTEKDGSQFVYEFVPKSEETIPACD